MTDKILYLGADVSQALAGVQRVDAAINNLTRGVERISQSSAVINKIFAGLGGAITSALSVSKFLSILNFMDMLADRADGIGISIERLQRLRIAGALAGIRRPEDVIARGEGFLGRMRAGDREAIELGKLIGVGFTASVEDLLRAASGSPWVGRIFGRGAVGMPIAAMTQPVPEGAIIPADVVRVAAAVTDELDVLKSEIIVKLSPAILRIANAISVATRNIKTVAGAGALALVGAGYLKLGKKFSTEYTKHFSSYSKKFLWVAERAKNKIFSGEGYPSFYDVAMRGFSDALSPMAMIRYRRRPIESRESQAIFDGLFEIITSGAALYNRVMLRDYNLAMRGALQKKKFMPRFETSFFQAIGDLMASSVKLPSVKKIKLPFVEKIFNSLQAVVEAFASDIKKFLCVAGPALGVLGGTLVASGFILTRGMSMYSREWNAFWARVGSSLRRATDTLSETTITLKIFTRDLFGFRVNDALQALTNALRGAYNQILKILGHSVDVVSEAFGGPALVYDLGGEAGPAVRNRAMMLQAYEEKIKSFADGIVTQVDELQKLVDALPKPRESFGAPLQVLQRVAEKQKIFEEAETKIKNY